MTAGRRIRARIAGRQGDFRFDIDAVFPADGVTAVFGPSGGGKSTLLRAIAGLSRFGGAEIVVEDEIWQSGDVFVPPHKRALGCVFQDARLFAHLNVRENLVFGLKRAGPDPIVKFDDVVSLMGLGAMLERGVGALSGGERQRVAIGRALLAQPRLILMDEPISALDLQSRAEIMPYLKLLHRNLSAPMIYVTHDMTEVERLADWIVVLGEGRVIAAGPLSQVQADMTAPIARRPEAAVTLDARICGRDDAYGLIALEVPGGRFWAPGTAGELWERMRIQVAASDVSLSVEPPSETTILNLLTARIISIDPTDSFQMVAVLALGAEGEGVRILARVTRRSVDALGLRPGMTAYAQVKGVALAEATGLQA